MDYSPKYKQPFTFAQACELDVPTITKEIERLENSLFHLSRTQVELEKHMSGIEDEDRELLDVFKENEGVIASQNERITMLKLALEDQAVNTRSGHYDSAEPAGGSSNNTSSQRTQNPTTADHDDSRQEERTGLEERDDGVYL